MAIPTSTHVLTAPVSERDHFSGSLGARLQLVEYGDYECPFCRAAQPVVEEVTRRLDQELCCAYRHFPIVSAHPHALHAAEAAEAAGAQGKFWAMHAWLFEHQDQLDDESLVYHAMRLGLDPRRFVGDLVEHRFIPKIREDLATGARSGVNGTPTFFVNSIRYEGPRDPESIIMALEATARVQAGAAPSPGG
ncbi:MAG: oxidoreductase [Actinomycetia bacterium]|nr:oxidoreductase [Actinomycetes bacterium]